MVQRRLFLCLIVTLLAASAALAQLPGTLFGQVSDVTTSEPIAGVTIKVTDPESPDFLQEETTDEKGRYRIFVQSSLPAYTLALSKEGYQGFTMPGVKIPARQRTRRNFELKSAAEVMAERGDQPVGDAPVEETKATGFLKLYNEGVEAMNNNDFATAETRFSAALEQNDEYGPAYGGLARAAWKQEKWDVAAEAGEKSLELNPEDADVHQVLYAAYSGLGETAKAEAALAKMQSANPEKAGKNMFNQAADLYNGGQIDEAKKLFEQIVSVDPNQPKAHYMLGMCYISGGENAKAKEHLGKFLELDPNDPDAATAKEMMQYLE